MNLKEINKFIENINDISHKLNFSSKFEDSYFIWQNNNCSIYVIPYFDSLEIIDDLSNKNVIIVPFTGCDVPSELYKNYLVLSIVELKEILHLKKELDEDTFEIVFLTLLNCKNISNVYKKICLKTNVKKELNKDNAKNDKKAERYNSAISDLNIDIPKYINSIYGECKKVKRYYINDKNSTAVIPIISKRYDRTTFNYWYSFHDYQEKVFNKYDNGILMLILKDLQSCVLLPKEFIFSMKDKMGKSPNGGNPYYHIYLIEKNGKIYFRLPNQDSIDITVFYKSICIEMTNNSIEDSDENKSVQVIKIKSGFKSVHYKK